MYDTGKGSGKSSRAKNVRKGVQELELRENIDLDPADTSASNLINSDFKPIAKTEQIMAIIEAKVFTRAVEQGTLRCWLVGRKLSPSIKAPIWHHTTPNGTPTGGYFGAASENFCKIDLIRPYQTSLSLNDGEKNSLYRQADAIAASWSDHVREIRQSYFSKQYGKIVEQFDMLSGKQL